MPGGRPTKLTPELQERICLAIRAGNYIEVAASFAGIHKDTFYRWLKRGARASRGIYREFSDAVEKALADSEAGDVARISKAAEQGHWQAAAWRLERKHPQRWGRRDRVQTEISGPGGGPIGVNISAREELAGLIARLAQRVREAEGAAGQG
jgi:hypothetical protein